MSEYKTFHIHAPSEQAVVDMIKQAGFATSDGRIQYEGRNHCFILRGTIYEPTGNTIVDDEGLEIPELAPVSGVHADLYTTGELPAPLSEYQTTPANPPYRRAGE